MRVCGFDSNQNESSSKLDNARHIEDVKVFLAATTSSKTVL